MSPPSQYYPPPDGKGEQYWKAGGVVTSNLEIFTRKKTQGLSHRGKEYSGNSNEQAGFNLERFEQGDKSLSGLQSGENCPLDDEEKDKGDNRMMLYPQNMPPNLLRNMRGYSQGHAHYPTQSLYYPPQPPSYGNPSIGPYPPPETWNAPHPSYLPHYDTNNTFHIPPYPYGIIAPHLHSSSTRLVMSPGRGNDAKDKKRQRSSSSHENLSHHAPLKERNLFTMQNPCKPSSQSSFQVAKSVRRKKKMYSDFVGVTYNKTHAKYQACITHYRKQHYLGRYKLAVDAALAYDESARLLKGSSWKVNFLTRQIYEEAKVRELESIGKMGGSSVDVASSLAAVAMKVEEIASNFGHPRAFGEVVARSEFCGPKRVHLPLITAHVGFCFSEDHTGHENRIKNFFPQRIRVGKYEKRMTPGLPPLETAIPTPAVMTKVTPSPTFQMISISEHRESPLASSKSRSLETPLPVSPNPTRHTMGTEKSTPDSVIRPTVLTYNGGKDSLSAEHIMVKRPLPINQALLTITGDIVRQQVVQPNYSEAKIAKNMAFLCSPLMAESMVSTALKAKPTAAVASPKPAPPVIQNGTLAAASALMTLFGTEKCAEDSEDH